MSSPFVGQIVLLGCNFAPTGFSFCAGQLLQISQNTALFSLLGTTYGGNGQTTFALPNLEGLVAIGSGQGPGLSDHVVGESGGEEVVTLIASEMPAHTHTLAPTGPTTLTLTPRCYSGPGNQRTPVGAVPAKETSNVTATYSSDAPDAAANSGAIALGGPTSVTGGGLPHENRQPYLTLNYCIAMQGVFPPRQ